MSTDITLAVSNSEVSEVTDIAMSQAPDLSSTPVATNGVNSNVSTTKTDVSNPVTQKLVLTQIPEIPKTCTSCITPWQHTKVKKHRDSEVTLCDVHSSLNSNQVQQNSCNIADNAPQICETVDSANLVECKRMRICESEKTDKTGLIDHKTGAGDSYHSDTRQTNQNNNVQKVLEEEGCDVRVVSRRTRGSVGRSDHRMTCPVCHAHVKVSDYQNHYQLEVGRIEKWTSQYCRKQRKRLWNSENQRQSSKDSQQTDPCQGEEVMSHKDRYKVYLRIKVNRSRRQQKPVRTGGQSTECPVCRNTIVGSQQELNRHVNLCLIKEDGEVDIEGSDDSNPTEQFEEYEWAGQTRIRATTMIDSCFSESGFTVGQKGREDEELDIEQDETDLYGSAQFTEADLIPCSADEPEEEKQRQALRKVMLQGESQTDSQSGGSKWPVQQGVRSDSSQQQQAAEVAQHSCQQAADSESSKYKCLICMEEFDRPVTSVACWHVHCEECWLRTLGAKKLCPQCNTITHPSHLRKIYL